MCHSYVGFFLYWYEGCQVRGRDRPSEYRVSNPHKTFKKTQCIALKFPNCVVSITHMLIIIEKKNFIFDTLLTWIFNIRFSFEQICEKEFKSSFITQYLNVSIVKKMMI